MITKKMKRTLIVSCLACLVPTIGCADNSENLNNMNFEDVKKEAWYYEAVDYSYNNGFLEGVSKDEFMPDSNMTRAMFATVLGRKSEDDMSKYENKSSFNDVSEDTYYSKYVKWAKDNKIMIGDGRDNFYPEENITRQEAVTALRNYYREKYNIRSEYEIKSIYSDISDISDYALDAFGWAVENNIVEGFDNKLNPLDNLSRAEMAQLILNLKEYEIFLSEKTIIPFKADEIESIEVNYDPGFPENEGKNFKMTKTDEINKFIDTINEAEIEKVENSADGELTGDDRLILILNMKNGKKYKYSISGEEKNTNFAISKADYRFIFKDPIALDF